MRRTITAVLAAALCIWALWQAARVGLGRTLSGYAVTHRRDNVNDFVLKLTALADEKAAADRAVGLLPNDAETHASRADLLQQLTDYPQARDEFARAVQLRPHDYYLWMMLGVT